MKKFKGTIALDIDGTVTIHHDHLETPVKKYLEHLMNSGWQLIFVTGRTFSFAHQALASLNGTYLFSVQNGAALYEMPTRKLMKRNFLDSNLVGKLEKAIRKEGTGLLVESGWENKDVCYYISKDFSIEERDYLHFRMSISPEHWEDLRAFNTLPVSTFAVGKFFADEEKANRIASELLKDKSFRVTVIRDPFRSGFHLALIHALNATKGLIVKQVCVGPLIAAGDDYNDLEMLQEANIKIVMGNAPKEMHPKGDIIAPPAAEQGIIPALEEALSQL